MHKKYTHFVNSELHKAKYGFYLKQLFKLNLIPSLTCVKDDENRLPCT